MLGRLGALGGSLLILTLAATLAQAVEGDEHWSSAFALPGTEGAVLASLTFQGSLVIGGDFRHVGALAANRVARWDGSAWSPMGDGFDAPVQALAEFNGELYAGGSFEHSGDRLVQSVARWDGATWQPVGAQLDWYDVQALAKYGGRLIAGGRERGHGVYGEWFEMAGLSAWDGSQWTEIAEFAWDFSSSVHSLAVSEPGLVAAGDFRAIGGDESFAGVACWDGITWHSMGQYFYPSSLLVISGQLLAAYSGSVYGWNGQTWVQATANSGMGQFRDLVFYDGSFVACYTTSNGQTAGVLRWDGSAWLPMGVVFRTADGSRPSLLMLGVHAGQLFTGGHFTQIGSAGIPCLARWDGSGWGEFTPTAGGANCNGLDGSVYGLGSYAGELVAGGTFDYAWRTVLYGIGRWTGSSWEPFGTGLPDADDEIRAFCEYQGQLVVSGWFQEIGDVTAINMAAWTGGAWLPFGEGPAPSAWALLAQGDDLFAAGYFDAAGGVPANSIARWDGSSWSDLDGGLNSMVEALAFNDGALVAGGRFTADVHGQALGYIARWDGGAWHPLGAGFDARVEALASWRGEIVAGGQFTHADGQPAAYLARWDGQGWQAIPEGPDAPVARLTVYHDDLIVAGEFAMAGGQQVNGIARWDGERWTSLGSGLSFLSYYMLSIAGLVAIGDDLFVAGTFLNAGGQASYGIARWTEGTTAAPDSNPATPSLSAWNFPNPFNPRTEIVFTLPTAAPVTLRIVDASGRLVRTLLAAASRPAGEQRITWDGHDDAGRRVGSGVYLLSIEADGRTAQRKLVLLK